MSRTFTLQAEDAKEAEEWLQAIHTLIAVRARQPPSVSISEGMGAGIGNGEIIFFAVGVFSVVNICELLCFVCCCTIVRDFCLSCAFIVQLIYSVFVLISDKFCFRDNRGRERGRGRLGTYTLRGVCVIVIVKIV